jgi:hypothetical protein
MNSVKYCSEADVWKKILIRPNVLRDYFPETNATSHNKFPKPSVTMKRWTISLSDILNGMQLFLDSSHLLSGSGRDVNIIRMNILKEERSVIFVTYLCNYIISTDRIAAAIMCFSRYAIFVQDMSRRKESSCLMRHNIFLIEFRQ